METEFPASVEDGTAVAQAKAELDFVEGDSPGKLRVAAVIREVAQSDVPVLLLAEGGAGKKATARRIHNLSRRNGQSFRVLACANLRCQPFESAPLEEGLRGRGTVFLQEVADLNAECQEKLLQALTRTDHNHNGSRTGGGARLICGSARDLEAEVKTGTLREDLYYRISGVCLRLPPLRQRREDIPVLVDHFLRKYAQEFQRPAPALSKQTQRLFQEYSWPGNVRELENAAKAIVALGNEAMAMGGLRAVLCRPDVAVNGNRVSLKQAARAASREAEKELILKALTRTHWNRRRAAEELRISYKALLYKLKQIGCDEIGAS